jgi:hypothetical protein
MTTYTSAFTGNVIQPTDVSYASVALTQSIQLYWPQYANDTQQTTARIMEFTANNTGYAVTLPDATQASDGQDILIRNTGLYPIFFQRFDGTGSFTVNGGQAFYTYIVDDSTQAGVWALLQFGTGTSVADAATLAGASTAAILGHLEASFVTSQYVTPPTINDATRGNCLVWTSGVGTWTLPPVSSLSQGWFILVRNNGTGALTINPATGSSSLIDGLGSLTLPLGDSCFVCVNRDPAVQEFFTVGRSRPNSLTFTSATYDVDTIAGSSLNLVSNTPIIQRFTALAGTRSSSLLVQLPAVTQVYYLLNDTNQSGYTINFQVYGSSQTPFTLAYNSQAILLSDGNNVWPLIQSNIGTQLVNRGTAAAPAYAFAPDHASGMYSPNDGMLGFSAGGNNIMTLDSTGGTGNYITTMVGRLQADLISGGGF